MKIHKLLPLLAIAAMLTPAAFADGVSANTNLEISVGRYINITNQTQDASRTTTTTFDTDYSAIHLTNALIPTFRVVTNWNGDAVQVAATAPITGGTTTPSLGGTDAEHPVIAFGNDTHRPTLQAIAKAIEGNAAESANAIAFQFTWDKDGCPDTSTPAAITNEPAVDTANGLIKYGLKNGAYTFKYTSAQTAYGNSFSTFDEDGTYKATITMSQTNL